MIGPHFLNCVIRQTGIVNPEATAYNPGARRSLFTVSAFTTVTVSSSYQTGSNFCKEEAFLKKEFCSFRNALWWEYPCVTEKDHTTTTQLKLSLRVVFRLTNILLRRREHSKNKSMVIVLEDDVIAVEHTYKHMTHKKRSKSKVDSDSRFFAKRQKDNNNTITHTISKPDRPICSPTVASVTSQDNSFFICTHS